MLTIGQLAESAGVTIKAVRHYHARGLEEPPRDSSGYRRYSVEHAILLIKIKTLAEAGVLLARIKELLAADSDRFAPALARSTTSCKSTRPTSGLCVRSRWQQRGGVCHAPSLFSAVSGVDLRSARSTHKYD
jgi:DNA-binding transcriptional MerR regulator